MLGIATLKWPRAIAAAMLGIAMVWSGWPLATTEASDACPDLQSAIDGAASGATVVVPDCDFRVTLMLDRPITLRAPAGAMIDGSDVWTAWDGRRSLATVPALVAVDACSTQQSACADRRRVWLDGAQLRSVEADPSSGEFAIDSSGHVLLGDDPAGRLVEVVVRETWMTVNASDVTVEGFTMRNASNAPQTGAVRVKSGVSRFTLRDCDLGYAAGANVSIGVANDSVIENCDIHHGGQLGVHLGGDGTNGYGNVLRNNNIHDNNTAGFDPEWEAGGVKATRQTGLKMTGNTVSGNVGPGLWCDIYCRDIVVSDNRIYHNTHAGIFFEVSTGAKIANNRIWENGWSKASWGWGAGILISSSGGADVSGNIVAWNYVGISVLSQNRQDWSHSATDNNVHDNVVIAEGDRYAVIWAQDWSGVLWNASSNNRGANNRYWVNSAEDGRRRFAWQGDKGSLSAFNTTPAENAGSYLTDSQKTTTLSDAGMPPGSDLVRPEDPVLRGVLVGLAAAALLLLAIASIARLRRRRRNRP